jgi:hypothetical protein
MELKCWFNCSIVTYLGLKDVIDDIRLYEWSSTMHLDM